MRKSLAFSVGLLGFLQAGLAYGENACRNATDVKPGQLYVVAGDQLIALGSSRTPFRARRLTFVYASSNSVSGGVVSIKQLNETTASPGSRDVQAVALDRPAVSEPCYNGHRSATRRGDAVSAREYAGYHSDRKQRSDKLDLFHFDYKPEGSSACRATNDESIGGRTHYLYSGSRIEPKYRAASVEAGGAGAQLTAFITALKGFLAPPAEASRGGGTDQAQPAVRYVYLRTILRRHEGRRSGPSCVSFEIDSDRTLTSTYVTITDLEDFGTFARPQMTWQIRWQGAE